MPQNVARPYQIVFVVIYDNPKVQRAAEQVGLPNGRMISQSKSGFHERHPDHVAVSNATIADDEGFGARWGDLDLTADEPRLQELAGLVDGALHVLWGGDTAWFRGTEPAKSSLRLVVIHLTASGGTVLGEERGRSLARNADGALVRRRAE